MCDGRSHYSLKLTLFLNFFYWVEVHVSQLLSSARFGDIFIFCKGALSLILLLLVFFLMFV